MASTTKIMSALLVIEEIEKPGSALSYATECTVSFSAYLSMIASSSTPRFEPSASNAEALYGSALAAGVFDGDDIADLVISIPAYSVSGAWRSGATRVLDGDSSGLAASRQRTWSGL